MERFCKAAILHVLLLYLLSVVSSSCPPPPMRLGTNCSHSDIETFQESFNITCTCMFGFNRVGPGTRQCTRGTWSGSDDICRIDAVSIALACMTGLSAILVFTTLSCFLIQRNRPRSAPAKRPPAAHQDDDDQHYTPAPATKERSDSGLQTDMDMEEIDFNDFSFDVESPTDNNAPDGLVFIEE